MILRKLTRQTGVTLVELMIGLAAGLVVVLAGTTMLTTTLTADATNMRYTRLNQDLRAVSNTVSKDLARAGEWSLADDMVHASLTSDLSFSGTSGAVTATTQARGSTTAINSLAAPITAAAMTGRTLVVLMRVAGVTTRFNLQVTGRPSDSSLSVTIPVGTTLPATLASAGSWTVVNPFLGVTTNVANNCVLVSYDLNGNGVRDTNENFGFRLDTVEGAVETTTTATACNSGSWENFTDPAFVDVSAFSLTQIRTTSTPANLLNAVLDQYVLTLAGALQSEAEAVRTLQQAVKVRNNAFN